MQKRKRGNSNLEGLENLGYQRINSNQKQIELGKSFSFVHRGVKLMR